MPCSFCSAAAAPRTPSGEPLMSCSHVQLRHERKSEAGDVTPHARHGCCMVKFGHASGLRAWSDNALASQGKSGSAAAECAAACS